MPRVTIVCLGEALVDLIPSPRGSGAAARPEPHFGGALANVAVAAARAGAPVALAGGTGTDAFGDLLCGTLEAEGVALALLHRIPGLETPSAEVVLGVGGEPSYRIRGDSIEAGLEPLIGHERRVVESAEALVIGSNTLVGDPGRRVTLAVVALARELGVPVLFDPNLRRGRWPDLEEALELCRTVAASCLLVKSNLEEARLIAGEPALETPAAAEALAALGATQAVVTAGPKAAVARGADSAECVPPLVATPQPIGAGDALMGSLTAALSRQAWRPRPMAAALAAAVESGSAACRTAGAIA